MQRGGSSGLDFSVRFQATRLAGQQGACQPGPPGPWHCQGLLRGVTSEGGQPAEGSWWPTGGSSESSAHALRWIKRKRCEAGGGGGLRGGVKRLMLWAGVVRKRVRLGEARGKTPACMQRAMRGKPAAPGGGGVGRLWSACCPHGSAAAAPCAAAGGAGAAAALCEARAERGFLP